MHDRFHVHADMRRDPLLAHIAEHLHALDRKLETIMANQAELDAAVAALATSLSAMAGSIAQLDAETTELTDGTARVVAELARLNDLVASGGTVDLTGLTNLVGAISGTADALSAQTAALVVAADAAEGAVPPPSP